jgi:hypothetical protein
MAQDWSVHALVYFYSVGSDLPWAVSYWRLDLESADMTQEDIIRMAREVGLWPAVTDNFPKELVALAALVAAAEREECALIGDSMDSLQDGAIGRAIRARGQA